MATRKNTAVSISQKLDGNVEIKSGSIETYTMDEAAFRNSLESIEQLHLLLCLMSIKVDDASLNVQTATFSAIKSVIDGNYKV
jgi:hypothetical protein